MLRHPFTNFSHREYYILSMIDDVLIVFARIEAMSHEATLEQYIRLSLICIV